MAATDQWDRIRRDIERSCPPNAADLHRLVGLSQTLAGLFRADVQGSFAWMMDEELRFNVRECIERVRQSSTLTADQKQTIIDGFELAIAAPMSTADREILRRHT